MSDRVKSSLVNFLSEVDKKKLLNYTRASQFPHAKAVVAAATEPLVDFEQSDSRNVLGICCPRLH